MRIEEGKTSHCICVLLWLCLVGVVFLCVSHFCIALIIVWNENDFYIMLWFVVYMKNEKCEFIMSVTLWVQVKERERGVWCNEGEEEGENVVVREKVDKKVSSTLIKEWGVNLKQSSVQITGPKYTPHHFENFQAHFAF